jgi:hypothetical protein
MLFQHPPHASARILKWFLLASICLASQILHGQNKDDGLNSLFELPLWIDSTLWDDKADFTARRLSLQGTVNGATGFYRGSYGGTVPCLGIRLYALDLYSDNGQVQRVVLGFVNRADSVALASGLNSRAYEKAAETDFDIARLRLIKRLGQPSQRANAEVWSWIGHELVLSKGPEALTLTIQKGGTSANSSPEKRLMEQKTTRNPPSYFVKRAGNGDCYIEGLPPISQGDRNYCVPASWEKSLRHLGLGLNVYDLAQKGGTQVNGTAFLPFAREMEHLLTPLRYQVTYIRPGQNDFSALKPYIDQGLPLIWGMNANRLSDWVLRNRQRKEQLPPTTFSTKEAAPALHALLIIGYNNNYKEIALSDSTEMGSSTPCIWIKTTEMQDAEYGAMPKIVVIPPAGSNQARAGFIKPKWY